MFRTRRVSRCEGLENAWLSEGDAVSPAKTLLIVVALLLLLVVVVVIGRGVSWLAHERDHPTEANQWLRLFLPPKSPAMSSYFPDPKTAASAFATPSRGCPSTS